MAPRGVRVNKGPASPPGCWRFAGEGPRWTGADDCAKGWASIHSEDSQLPMTPVEKFEPLTRAGVAAAALMVFPLIALIAFAAPQTDDFCFASTYHDYGLLDGVTETWRAWNGRASATFLAMVPFAVSGEPDGMLAVYRIMLLGFAGAWMAVAYAACRLWFADARLRLVMWAFFTAAFWVLPANFREQFLWLPAAVTYMTPAICLSALFLFLFAPVICWAENKELSTPSSTVTLMWCAALATTAVASLANEFSGFTAIAIAAASFTARRRAGAPAAPIGHAAIVIIAIACFAYMVAAPGNAIRAANFEESASWWLTLSHTPLHTVEFFIYHALMPGHIAWYCALAIIASFAPAFRETKSARETALIIVAVTICAVAFSYAVGLWGTDNRLPGRAQNQLHLTAAIWLSTALVFYIRSGARLAVISFLQGHVTRAPYVAAGAAALLVAANPYTYAAYRAIFSGDAAVYSRETRERMHVLADAPPGSSVVLSRQTVLPDVLSSYGPGGAGDNKECQAAAFGLKSVSEAPRAN